jgi:hypothetical protein
LKISPDGIDTLVLETDEALNQCNGLIKKAG